MLTENHAKLKAPFNHMGVIDMPKQSDQKRKFYTELSARLREALELRGFATLPSQVAKIAAVTGRTKQTAKRWLAEGKGMRDFNDIHAIAEELNVHLDWMYGTTTLPLKDYEALMAIWKSLNEWERSKYLRFSIRLRNNDAKAFRLSDMYHIGQLTRQQFFAMM